MRVRLAQPSRRLPEADPERERTRRSVRPAPGLSGPAAAVFRLQREQGNRVARELLQRQNRAPGEEDEEEPLIQRLAVPGPARRRT